MPGSNKYLNYSDFTITPAGGTAIVLPEVTDIDVKTAERTETWRASGHRFATLIVATESDRTVTVTSGAVGVINSIPIGVACTLAWTLLDGKNGTGSGSLAHQLVNAVRTDSPHKETSNKFVSGTITFVAYSADGNTDPLTVTVTP